MVTNSRKKRAEACSIRFSLAFIKKNVMLMKKFSLIACTLMAVGLTACDPGFQEEYFFNNQSGHTVTILSLIDLSETYYDVPGGEPPRQSYFRNLQGLTIPDGEQLLLYEWGALGLANKDHTVDVLQHYIYGDSVRFLFDDGHYLDFAWNEWAPNSPYIENNYHSLFRDDNSYGCMTYTLWNDDYIRATLPSQHE